MDEMNYNPSTQDNSQYTNQVPKVSTAGYWVLSIAALLFGGIIFGVLSIMSTRKINSATTIEEQQKAKKNAVMWAVIGLVLGIGFSLIQMFL